MVRGSTDEIMKKGNKLIESSISRGDIIVTNSLYVPETNIELFRSAVETAVTSPGELVVSG